MSVFGGGIGQYADARGTYAEHIQGWLDISCSALGESAYTMLGIGDLFGTQTPFGSLSVSYPVYEIDAQLPVLFKAIQAGVEFEFEDGRSANGWLYWFNTMMNPLGDMA